MTDTHKKVELLNVEAGYGVTVEDNGMHYTLCITEYRENEEKSTDNRKHYETASATEIYIDGKELHEIIDALMYIKDDNL